jgi:hypothetical protein
VGKELSSPAEEALGVQVEAVEGVQVDFAGGCHVLRGLTLGEAVVEIGRKPVVPEMLLKLLAFEAPQLLLEGVILRGFRAMNPSLVVAASMA